MAFRLTAANAYDDCSAQRGCQRHAFPIVAVLTFDHFSPFTAQSLPLIFGDIPPGQLPFELRLCCGDAASTQFGHKVSPFRHPYGLEG